MLSSLEGFAITSIKIEGVEHEFSTIDGVIEDVTEIVLNLKQIRFKQQIENENSETAIIKVSSQKTITAADVANGLSNFQVLNPEQIVCNMDKKVSFEMEILIEKGRGYVPAEDNSKEEKFYKKIKLEMNNNSKYTSIAIGGDINYDVKTKDNKVTNNIIGTIHEIIHIQSFEDFDIWVRGSLISKFAYLDKVLISKRVHSNQFSKRMFSYKDGGDYYVSTLRVCEFAFNQVVSGEEINSLVVRLRYEGRNASYYQFPISMGYRDLLVKLGMWTNYTSFKWGVISLIGYGISWLRNF